MWNTCPHLRAAEALAPTLGLLCLHFSCTLCIEVSRRAAISTAWLDSTAMHRRIYDRCVLVGDRHHHV